MFNMQDLSMLILVVGLLFVIIVCITVIICFKSYQRSVEAKTLLAAVNERLQAHALDLPYPPPGVPIPDALDRMVRDLDDEMAASEESFKYAQAGLASGDAAARGLKVFYCHRNIAGSVHVKTEEWFIEQGGLNASWGKRWAPVTATDIEHARKTFERACGEAA